MSFYQKSGRLWIFVKYYFEYLNAITDTSVVNKKMEMKGKYVLYYKKKSAI